MSQVTQKQAVYFAIKSVLAESGINHDDGQDVHGILSKDMRAMVSAVLVEGFKAKKIQLDREYDDVGLKAYVSGLMSNWIRKDTRLNGGVGYVAKNPGSRAGNSDPQIKAMKALLSTLTDESEKAEVQAEIDKRQGELESAKQKVVVDFSKLPESLKAKFTK